ncbi:MAG: hypothetical protein ABSE59_08925, partial [Opitutaceae bacterium]
IKRLHFNSEVERLVGCTLATADYLAQMATPDYPDKLEVLFAEFHEADAFANVPPGQREYLSAADLVERTPDFWRSTVLPKLKTEYGGVYRYLAKPFPRGPNPYVEAVERNLAVIKERLANGIVSNRTEPV